VAPRIFFKGGIEIRMRSDGKVHQQKRKPVTSSFQEASLRVQQAKRRGTRRWSAKARRPARSAPIRYAEWLARCNAIQRSSRNSRGRKKERSLRRHLRSRTSGLCPL